MSTKFRFQGQCKRFIRGPNDVTLYSCVIIAILFSLYMIGLMDMNSPVFLHIPSVNHVPSASIPIPITKEELSWVKRMSSNSTTTSRIRLYFNPLKALIDQSVIWVGKFKREVREMQKRPGIHDPVRFELIYSENGPSHPSINNIIPPLLKTPGINCEKLIQGDEEEIIRAERIQNYNESSLVRQLIPSDFQIYSKTHNCKTYVHESGFVIDSATNEEENFPIAYSIMVYREAGQVEHLLRAIYRPQNYYCIHIDANANKTFHVAIRSLVNCFGNVFIASRSLPVSWGRMSVLEADSTCMKDLWAKTANKTKKWKYFINLTGQEFPLKTNWEIVKILKSYRGAIDVGHTAAKVWHFRTNCSYNFSMPRRPPRCLKPKTGYPHNFTRGKGPVHVALTHEFVDFCLHNKIAQDLYSWLNDTMIPDESFFQSLYLSPQAGVPGAYTGEQSISPRNTHPMVRFKKWEWWRPCRGITVRNICIMTIWDLPELARRPEMFVNKFHANYHPWAYSCLEELHRNRTREDILAAKTGRMVLGIDGRELPYSGLPWVRKHI